MAFADTANKLLRVGPQNSNGPTLWTYETADALTAVDAAGYFSAAADKLQVGDWIFARCNSTTFGIFVINANSRDLSASPPVFGVVDAANATAVGAIDSD
jgi:hypothetical protein